VVRKQIGKLIALGPLPSEVAASVDQVLSYQLLIEQISPPLEDDEAKDLLGIFGPDDFFGLGWTLLHLIETAPNSPVTSMPSDSANEWVHRIWRREQRGRARSPD
jgi:hypothetical protein